MFDDTRDELSPAEERAFAALPREVMPSPNLEERTVSLLRENGQLPYPLSETMAARRSGGQAVGRSEKAKDVRVLWLTGAIAAALALFTSGIAVGQYLGARSAAEVATATRGASAVETAAQLERAGDIYLAALASVSQLPDTADARGRDVARQVALSVLGAAAEEVAHFAPDDPLAAAVLRGLDQRGKMQRPAPPSRSVVWF